MPRLIDAYKVRCDRDEYDTYADYIKAFDAINEAPTVEAIPLDWLREHIVTIEQQWILEDWEREHETD